MGRFLVILLFLFATIALPFALWGDALEVALSPDRLQAWLEGSRETAWLIAIGLLTIDILLPIPSAVVIGFLGIVYGTVLGGMIAMAGLLLNGVLGYLICRALGRRLAIRLAGESSLDKADRLFAQHGGWIVAISRSLPVLAEAVAMSAGLAAMPVSRMLLAMVIGIVPVAFLYAWLGSLGAGDPMLVIAACLGLSALLWWISVVAFDSRIVRNRQAPSLANRLGLPID